MSTPSRSLPASVLSLAVLGLALPTLRAQDGVAPRGTEAAKVTLTVLAPVDHEAWFSIKSKTAQDIDMGGQEMSMGFDTEFVLASKVTAAGADGARTLTATVAAVRGQMELPMMGEVAFDSTNPDGNDDDMGLGTAVASLAGSVFTVTVSSQGRITEIKGVDEALAKARGKADGMGGQMLAGILNDGIIRRQVQAIFGTLPKAGVAVGEQWDGASEKASGRVPVQNKTRLTLAKVDAEHAEITVNGTLEMARGGVTDEAIAGAGVGADEEMTDQMREMLKGMKVENGVITGVERVLRKDGMVVDASSDMTMDLTMPGPMGGDMKIRQTTRMTVQRTTAAAAKGGKPAKAGPADQGGKRGDQGK